MRERRWDLIGLSETRLRGEDVKTIHEDNLLVHKGAEYGQHIGNQVIVGDFNGHVGPRTLLLGDVIGPFSIGDTNSDGERIIDLCVRNGWSIMNTFFQHRPSHKWTWYRWNQEDQEYSQKSMIDLVLASRESLIHDVKAIPFLSLDSDHRVVVALIYLRFTLARPPVKRRRVAVDNLKEPEIKQRMDENLCAKIEINEEEEDVERAWESSKNAILESIEATVGFKYIGGKKKRTSFWNEEMRKAVKERNDAFRKWLKERTEDSRINYVRCRNVAKTTKRKVVGETWERIGRDLEEDFQIVHNIIYCDLPLL
ncbi:uncharacterized protein LOC143018122 [Oratosquilla oratoria]|uniref:uncharacterized protein LOC143018122 n=1 Tax=Oratosquilla oratoria TaxID=337810 RepID=UPI003F76A96F